MAEAGSTDNWNFAFVRLGNEVLRALTRRDIADIKRRLYAINQTSTPLLRAPAETDVALAIDTGCEIYAEKDPKIW